MFESILNFFGLTRKGDRLFYRVCSQIEHNDKTYIIYAYTSNPKTIREGKVFGNEKRYEYEVDLAKKQGYDSLMVRKSSGKADIQVFDDSQVVILGEGNYNG